MTEVNDQGYVHVPFMLYTVNDKVRIKFNILNGDEVELDSFESLVLAAKLERAAKEIYMTNEQPTLDKVVELNGG